MPNWCDNTIKITGTDDKIAKLWNTAFPSHGTMSEDGGLLESMKTEPQLFMVGHLVLGALLSKHSKHIKTRTQM
jgi:hypothetical protein